MANLDALEEEISSYHDTIDHYESYFVFLKDRESLHTTIETLDITNTTRLAELELVVCDTTTIENMRLEAEQAELSFQEYNKNLAIYQDAIEKKNAAKKIIAKHFQEIKLRPGLEKGKDIKSPKVMIDYLRGVIGIYESKLDNLTKTNAPRYQCPVCDHTVAVYKNSLIETTTSEKVKDAKQNINKLSDAISALKVHIDTLEAAALDFNIKPESPSDLETDHTTAYKDYLSATYIKEEYETLLNRLPPPKIVALQKRVDALEQQFKDEGDTDETNDYLKQLRSELHIKVSELEKIRAETNEYSQHSKQLTTKKKNVELLETQKPPIILRFSPEAKNVVTSDQGSRVKKSNGKKVINLPEMEAQMGRYTQAILDFTNDISHYRELLDSVADYEALLVAQADIEKLETKITDIAESETVTQRKLEGSLGLEETAKEAEMLLLEGTVNSINEYAKTYLDRFFHDEGPISVLLRCVKDGKKGATAKLQFNTTIEYKGDLYHDVEELSDSERQRCDIAFLLAVSDILRGEILIMDESVNCMNSEMNTDVLNVIHDVAGSNKLVLMTSHEAVRGVFDAEIPINPYNL